MVAPYPVTRANQGKASIRALGNVSRPSDVDPDALPGGRIGKGRLELGVGLDAAKAPVLVDPLDGDEEARLVDLDREATRLIDAVEIGGQSLVGRRGSLGARCRYHQGQERQQQPDNSTLHSAIPFQRRCNAKRERIGGPLAWLGRPGK
jgi:hypothetical protein